MINKYDELLKTANWLEETDLPVAIVLRETLESVEGDGAIIFPPTFAKKGDPPHPYQIDELRRDSPLEILNKDKDSKTQQVLQNLDGEDFNICEIDTVGRQADRMETSFKKEKLSALVPQIEIVADDQKVNLLEVGHRISDASIRYSTLDEAALPAIKKLADENDALPLAKLAPTSLIFGFWDSQKTRTQFKFGRILSSTIKATNVAVAKRSSQFTPGFDVVALNLATLEEVPEAGGEVESAKASDGKDPLSKIGLRSVPAVDKHGGVRVFGKITRRTQINLVGLRALNAKGETEEATTEMTMKLRRYLFGLALIGGRAQTNYALRQGCHLVLQSSAEIECSQILPDGTHEDFTWDLRDAYEFAKQAAEDFGVEKIPQALFEIEKARAAKAEAKKAK